MREKARQPSSRSGIPCGRVSRRRLGLVVGLAALLAACGSESDPGPPLVTANGETLQGRFFETSPPVAFFKGIPYAAPPVGELRWRPPTPHSPRQGVQAATEFGPACIQHPDHVPDWYRYLAETFDQDPGLVPELEPVSEDCLNLNVWTANLGGDEPWPVMVWIHGGANTSGSPSEVPYDGAKMTGKGVVVVSFNYRLNVFGFLAHPALTAESEHDSSGNYALLDQIAALEWIRRNIAVFGGDPERVTIFGESAGATNVAYLMSSPLAEGLFHRAIMQSGGYAVGEFRSLADLEAVGEGLVATLELGEADDVAAALRALSTEDIYRATLETYVDGLNVPNVDGWVLEEAPGHVFEAGRQAPAPLLIGFNSDEWTTLGHYGPDATLESLHEALRFGYGDLADRAIELYAASNDEEAAAMMDLSQTDLWFACPSRFIAERMARASADVYFYLFSRSLPTPGGDRLGAYHGAETAYVMDNLALEPWVPRESWDQELADAMSDYWVRFASTGDPNGGEYPVWPSYSSDSQQYLELGNTIRTGTGIRAEYCDLYDELQGQRLGSE